MLITVSIISVIGVVIYSAFANSIKVWQRLNSATAAEDIGISFEKLSTDLHNSFRFGDINFVGQKDKISFATIVHTADSKDEVGKVEYVFDNRANQLSRKQLSLSQIYQSKDVGARKIFAGFKEAHFQYYVWDVKANKFAWQESSSEVTPRAIKIKVDVASGVFSNIWTKIIAIPAEEGYNFSLNET